VKTRLLALFCWILLSLAAVAQTDQSQPSTPPQSPQSVAAQPPANAQPTASQSPASAPPPAAEQATTSSNFTSAKGFVLEDGTPVKLRINRTVSSGDAQTGDTVDFEVLEDTSVNGTLVIPKGGLAFATVTEAHPKRRIARGGRLDINIDYVKLISGERAPLRAVKEMKGGGHTGVMVGGMVATGILFFPAAPFFLFMHGKDISIPKGTEVTAYVSGDMKLDLAKFQPAPVQQSPVQPTIASATSSSTANPTSAKMQIESDPSGADIEVDGGFAGNTPSDVQVEEGDHTITVKKAGFKDWERKMRVGAGSSVHLNAELEKAQPQ
jgi:hypothetical protein